MRAPANVVALRSDSSLAAKETITKDAIDNEPVVNVAAVTEPITKPSIGGKASALERRRNFLSEVAIDFGPRDLLSRLFLAADTEMRRVGIDLHFAPIEALVELNARTDRKSWRPLVQIFDPRLGQYNASNGFCMLGRNVDGEVVAVQAARLYDFGASNFKEQAESLKLWYTDPERMRRPGESCPVSAPSADKLTGRALFSGAVWFRPDYRGKGVTYSLGRIVKAYAHTLWAADNSFAMMSEDVYARGTAKRAGFPHAEWSVDFNNTQYGTFRMALLWISAQEQLSYFQSYLDARKSEVDAGIEDRAANQ